MGGLTLLESCWWLFYSETVTKIMIMWLLLAYLPTLFEKSSGPSNMKLAQLQTVVT